MNRTARSALALAFLTAAAVAAVDQLTKSLVRSSLGADGGTAIFGGALKLVLVQNSGIAFGQLSGGGIIIVLLALAAVTALLWYFLRHLETPLIWLATGLVLGGAAGNLIDRLRAGSVTDFIKLPRWPAFNLADVAITIGVISLVVLVELDSRRKTRREGEDRTPG